MKQVDKFALREATMVVRKAEKKRNLLFKKLIRVGSFVHFDKWGGSITAKVIRVDYHGARLLVTNNSTGKQYWIELYDLIGYVGVGRY